MLAATASIADDEPGTLVLPVATGARVEAELLARPRERCDPQLLHHLQTVLAVELLKRRAVLDAERRLSGDLVESILAGTVSAGELRRRSGVFGLRRERPLAFLLLRPPRARHPGAGRAGRRGARRPARTRCATAAWRC